ncbi:MAG: transcriptional repressor [Firmicutes bacterium]|nr:transcriptional repressor [Bacillota bacterium]
MPRQRSLRQLEELLLHNDYRFTPQRRAIIEVFFDDGSGHLSAEDIYHQVRDKLPDVGLATVYRTLDILENLNVLHKLNFGDGRFRYEINQEGLHHHHHLVCLQCGQVSEVKTDLLNDLEEKIAREHGFNIVDHSLKFYGHCAACNKK